MPPGDVGRISDITLVILDAVAALLVYRRCGPSAVLGYAAADVRAGPGLPT